MDNIVRDVLEVKRLGYGVHYGHYKVDHPHTASREEFLPPPARELPVAETRICKECGKEFMPSHGLQSYCSHACQGERARRANAERKRRQVVGHGPAVCPVCGETFQREHLARKYCSRKCGRKASSQRAKEAAV